MWWIKLRVRLAVASLVVGAFVLSSVVGASAARHHRHHSATRRVQRRAPLYRGALLEEADTGKILYQENADMDWPPASMAKMMLMLIVEEKVEAGEFKRSDPVRISERSAMTGGSRLGLREGSIYPLGELMKAALVRSANDAAVAVAEKIAGSVEACVRLMNQRAHKLGLTRTHYNTVDGLPPRPGHDVDVTDAYDLATLGRALIRHPALLQLSGSEEVPFDGGPWVLHNTNHLVGHFDGCDGLKTGFTYQAGFNLTATAKRRNMRLVAVILGAPSNAQRFVQAGKLMEWGFDNFAQLSFLKRGQMVPIQVRLESGVITQPVAAEDVRVIVPKRDLSAIKVEYDIPSVLNTPLTADKRVGEIVIHDGKLVLTRVGAICPVHIADGAEVADDLGGSLATLPFGSAATAYSNHPQETK